MAFTQDICTHLRSDIKRMCRTPSRSRYWNGRELVRSVLERSRAETGLEIRVVLYDPLADSGLYRRWENNLGEGDRTGETNMNPEAAAEGIRCVVKVGDHEIEHWRFQSDESDDETEEYTVEQGDLLDHIARDEFNGADVNDLKIFRNGDDRTDDVLEDPPVNLHPGDVVRRNLPAGGPVLRLTGDISIGGLYTVEFPGLSTMGRDKADLSIVNHSLYDSGSDWDDPKPRERIRLRAPGSYTIRVWLRPNTIVFHWPVEEYRPNRAKYRYHFHVQGPVDGDDDNISWKAGGEHSGKPASWRFWWHNLRINGTSDLEKEHPGHETITIPIGRGLGARGTYHNTASHGYCAHAAGFNTNSIGIAFCGMEGVPDNDIDFEPGDEHEDCYLLTKEQMKCGIREIARLCRAWRLDPMDPNRLCTHYEVDRIHRGEGNKWDITWLPGAFQEGYRAFLAGNEAHFETWTNFDAEDAGLCEDGDGNYRRRVDIPLNDWKSEHRGDDSPDQTDRVSDYLRRLVKGVMDNPGSTDLNESAYWDDVVYD